MSHAKTQTRPTADPRLATLARSLFPNAPGTTRTFDQRRFFQHIRKESGGMQDGELECARLLARLAGEDALLEDIGQFDLVLALHKTTGAQRDALLAYLKEPWAQ